MLIPMRPYLEKYLKANKSILKLISFVCHFQVPLIDKWDYKVSYQGED
jgi:hypothetical protein